MNNKEELEYYLDTIIKTVNKASSIKHREDFDSSNYLKNEYKKCYAKINTFKYRIMKMIDR